MNNFNYNPNNMNNNMNNFNNMNIINNNMNNFYNIMDINNNNMKSCCFSAFFFLTCVNSNRKIISITILYH